MTVNLLSLAELQLALDALNIEIERRICGASDVLFSATRTNNLIALRDKLQREFEKMQRYV